jgi:hypothetical protein
MQLRPVASRIGAKAREEVHRHLVELVGWLGCVEIVGCPGEAGIDELRREA